MKRSEIRAVLDSSALLAFLQRERGYEIVRPMLRVAALSSVNLEEVLVRLGRRGFEPSRLPAQLRQRGIRLLPFTEEDAVLSSKVDSSIARTGALSLGDRACLALGLRLQVTVFTADRIWEELGLEVPIRVIR